MVIKVHEQQLIAPQANVLKMIEPEGISVVKSRELEEITSTLTPELRKPLWGRIC